MLRQFAATLRAFTTARVTPSYAAAAAVLLLGALLAGCGIKGPLKLPPPATPATPSTSVPTKPVVPTSPTEPPPMLDPPGSAKP